MLRRRVNAFRHRSHWLLAVALLGALLNFTVAPALAGAPPNRLDDERGVGSTTSVAGDICHIILGDLAGTLLCPDYHGRVLTHPNVHNIFAISGDWDAQVPPVFSEDAINNMTQEMLASSYLDAASQYGVGSATFQGSSSNNGCGGAPSGAIDGVTLEAWVTCEVQFGDGGIPLPGRNTLYVVYLPPSASVGFFGRHSCDDFTSYHFQSMALKALIPIPVPPGVVPIFQSYPYIVVPTGCAAGSMDGLTPLVSHELVEASTDPIVPHGWVDNSTIDFAGDFATAGEAADICSDAGAVPTGQVRLANGQLVAPYWSNADGACVPLGHMLSLGTSGLPTGGTATVTSTAIFGDSVPHTITLPQSFNVVDGAEVSWSFPTPINSGPGMRFTTGNTGSGGPTPINNDVFYTAHYDTEYLLTVNVRPYALTAADTSLTHNQWVRADQFVTLSTDAFIVSTPDRYRFDHWGGDFVSSDSSTALLMDGPKIETASYALQHELTFDQSGIPSGVGWAVSVEGTTHPGPYSEWIDDGSSISFSFQSSVPDPSTTTRYMLASVTSTSPLVVTSGGVINGAYTTQHLLTVQTLGLPAPNRTTITNAGVPIGNANDTSAVSVWLDHGTALSLAGNADVNAIDGTQFFAQNFTPTPPATLVGPVTTTLTYATMNELIDGALASGAISGHGSAGLANAFDHEFDSAQEALSAAQYQAALASLRAFISSVDAQSGASVTPETARSLELDALLAYHTTLCTAANELSAPQLSDDYAYYVQEVTRLGGTVLPPCP